MKPFTSLALTFGFIIATLPVFGATPAASGGAVAANLKERSRLEALFIWKTSEELKLDPATEQKFTEIIQSLNTRRRDANAKMDSALVSLSQAKSKADAEKALRAHRSALREVQAVQTAEIDKLQPLLGPEKLAQYITAKASILDKLKTMLSAPGTATSAPSAAAAGASAPQAVSAAPTQAPTATPHAPK